MNEKVQTIVDWIVPQWARDWLKKQEATTILLFAIFAMLPYIAQQAGCHIEKMNESSEKRNDAQIEASNRQLQTVIATFEADQERDEKRNERKDELLRDLLQRQGFAGELTPAEDLP